MQTALDVVKYDLKIDQKQFIHTEIKERYQHLHTSIKQQIMKFNKNDENCQVFKIGSVTEDINVR